MACLGIGVDQATGRARGIATAAERASAMAGAAAMIGPPAATAGLAHHQQPREAIPGVHVKFDIGIGAALGHPGQRQCAGSPATDTGTGRKDRAEGFQMRGIAHAWRPAEFDRGLRQHGRGGGGKPNAVLEGAAAAAGTVKLVRHRIECGAEFGHAVAHERHRDAEMIDAPGKIGGSVDRIGDPEGESIHRAAGLFPEKPVFRQCLRQLASDMGLHQAIGFRQEILLALKGEITGPAAAVGGQSESAGAADDIAQHGLAPVNLAVQGVGIRQSVCQ
jgi:hypothetical protein